MKTKLKTFRKASSKRARRDHVLVQPQGTPASTKAQRLLRKLHGEAEGSYDAFDPSIPVDGSLIVAGELRDQFNGLFALIQERVTEAELNSAVNNLTAQIDERVTQEELTNGMNIATAQAASQILPQTSNVSNGVNTLSVAAYSYYDQWQMQQVLDKIDELINALRR